MENMLIYHNMKFEKQDDLFDFLADELLSRSIVKESFRQSIKEREKKYPTGLKLQGLNVAIVHTDIEHSKEDAICILDLKNPVIFKNAENFEDLEVNLVIGLVLKNGEMHMKMLQKVAILLQDLEVIHQIKNAENEQEFKLLLQKYFGGEEIDKTTTEN